MTTMTKATKLLDDLKFAEQYIRFIAGRAVSADARVRARNLISAIDTLDALRPRWRDDAIQRLVSTMSGDVNIEEFFSPPEPDADELYHFIMRSITNNEKAGSDDDENKERVGR